MPYQLHNLLLIIEWSQTDDANQVDRHSNSQIVPEGLQSTNMLYVFHFRFTKYFFEVSENAFVPVQFDFYRPYSEVHERYSNGVAEGAEYENLVNQYGKCSIVLPDKNIFRLLVEEILNPFFVFQLFSVCFWFASEYEIYAGFIALTTLVSLIAELIDIKRNIRNLKKMVKYECEVTVLRRDQDNNMVERLVYSNDLVPGDIIKVPENAKMP